ncbi:30S ribosomal protein S17 [Bacillus sp. S34]|nr:30S ribosomal protein S17 [Bacillus sp. S34]
MANEEKTSAASARGYRKTRRGYVTSDKMDKTIVVEVEDRVKHALYGKIRRTTLVGKVDDVTASQSAALGRLIRDGATTTGCTRSFL